MVMEIWFQYTVENFLPSCGIEVLKKDCVVCRWMDRWMDG
jgi:hypothetical protein